MNTDIRLSTEFFRHPKTLKLKRRLGLEGIISLQQLWVWVAQNRPDGNLAGLDSEDIVLAACWEGEEAAFVQTLIDLRWLDVLEDGSLCLHNWRTRQEYASKSEERKEKARKAADARWSKSDVQAMPKASADMPRNSIGTSKHSASNAQPMLKNACSNAQACNEHPQAMPLTEPILTEHKEIQDPPLPPLQGEPDADASAVSASGDCDAHVELVGESPADEPEQVELSPEQPKRKRTDYRRKDYEEWKAEYGVKVDDDRLWKVWKKQIHKIPEQAVLMAALARYKQSKRWQDGYRKDPDNYLRGCCWNDDFTPAQPPRRYYGPDAHGRTPYVREDEQDFSNVPRDANGGVDWAQVMGGAK